MAPTATFWQKYGTLAQMAQATVALLGFIAILVQINTIAINAREASARQIYLAYNDIEFRHPQFSKPDYDRIKSGSQNEQVQYESFVSHFLYACEETMTVFSGKREWRVACDSDLHGHLPFLCEKMGTDPVYLAAYGAETQHWIKGALEQSSVAQPDCKLRKS